MDRQTKAEIIPLNQELYLALSIEDLEKRLELSPLLLAGDVPCETYCNQQGCVIAW